MNGPYYEATDPRYVYVFWSANGECLYVGCTVNLPARLGDHRRERDWWSDIARIEVQVHPDEDFGRGAEAGLIHRLNPTHNTVLTTHNESGRKSWVTRRANRAERLAQLGIAPSEASA